ncbi:MAG TPA: DUF4288 domain-containing protein [Solirubrobacteraceae bacterium]|nr:DUF4288 domain-containing protein [Solirubrobacteraceae bacterium]
MAEADEQGDSKLYVAVVLAEATSDADDERLYQESFVLVRAGSLEEATERAEELGRAEETQYRNETGATISWSLKRVVDVNEVLDDELDDGATVYARHFRDYDAYRRFEPLLADEPATGGVAADDPLALELLVPEAPVPPGEDVVVTVALVNRGSEPVVVNRRLLATPEGTPEALRELTFEVRGPAGYVNRTRLHVNAGRAGSEHRVELAPGERVEKPVELTRLHSLHLPGEYAVRATYGRTRSDWRVVRRAADGAATPG